MQFESKHQPNIFSGPGILGFQPGLKGENFFRNLIIELCHCRECKQAREKDQKKSPEEIHLIYLYNDRCDWNPGMIIDPRFYRKAPVR